MLENDRISSSVNRRDVKELIKRLNRSNCCSLAWKGGSPLYSNVYTRTLLQETIMDCALAGIKPLSYPVTKPLPPYRSDLQPARNEMHKIAHMQMIFFTAPNSPSHRDTIISHFGC
jgi:hypothetical protein